MRFLKKYGWIAPAITLFLCLFSQTAQASEIDLKIPLLDVEYNFWGHAVTGFADPALRPDRLRPGNALRLLRILQNQKDACSQINAEHGVFNL